MSFGSTAPWLDKHMLFRGVPLIFREPTWHPAELLRIVDNIIAISAAPIMREGRTRLGDSRHRYVAGTREEPAGDHAASPQSFRRLKPWPYCVHSPELFRPRRPRLNLREDTLRRSGLKPMLSCVSQRAPHFAWEVTARGELGGLNQVSSGNGGRAPLLQSWNLGYSKLSFQL